MLQRAEDLEHAIGMRQLSSSVLKPHVHACPAKTYLLCATQVNEGKAIAEMKDEEIAVARRDLQQCQTQLQAQEEVASAAQAAAAAQTAELGNKTARLAHLEGRQTPRSVTLPTSHKHARTWCFANVMSLTLVKLLLDLFRRPSFLCGYFSSCV